MRGGGHDAMRAEIVPLELSPYDGLVTLAGRRMCFKSNGLGARCQWTWVRVRVMIRVWGMYFHKSTHGVLTHNPHHTTNDWVLNN